MPPGVGGLTALEVLYLGDNRLHGDPGGRAGAPLARLPRGRRQRDHRAAGLDRRARALVELRVQHNRLTELPPAIGGLRALRELHLRGNAIQALPPDRALHELRAIDLRANGTPELPTALLDLPRLDKLDLRWNPYPELPAVAAACASAGASCSGPRLDPMRNRMDGSFEERRETRSARMAMGTLACPHCDAPVALAYPLRRPTGWAARTASTPARCAIFCL